MGEYVFHVISRSVEEMETHINQAVTVGIHFDLVIAESVDKLGKCSILQMFAFRPACLNKVGVRHARKTVERDYVGSGSCGIE